MAHPLQALQAVPVSGAELASRPASRLGEILAQRGLLEPASIPAILKAQQRWGCRFGEAMIAQGAITPVELAEVLAERCELPFADLIAEPPDATLCKASEIDLYLRHLFLPWRSVGGAAIIACADPSPEMRALARRLYGPRALLVVTAKFDIIWAVQRIFRETLGHDASYGLDERSPHLGRRAHAVPAGRRTDEDERSEPVRVREREALGDHAAERRADDVRRVMPGRVEDRLRVGGHLGDGVRAGWHVGRGE